LLGLWRAEELRTGKERWNAVVCFGSVVEGAWRRIAMVSALTEVVVRWTGAQTGNIDGMLSLKKTRSMSRR
jgi:hypothetical protein